MQPERRVGSLVHSGLQGTDRLVHRVQQFAARPHSTSGSADRFPQLSQLPRSVHAVREGGAVRQGR
eukprot:4654384-Alexandrium_andersonii.AAC.1